MAESGHWPSQGLSSHTGKNVKKYRNVVRIIAKNDISCDTSATYDSGDNVGIEQMDANFNTRTFTNCIILKPV